MWLHRSVLWIFIFVLSIIVGLNIFFSRGYHSISLKAPEWFNIITLTGALILVLLIVVMNQKIIEAIRKIPIIFIVPFLLLSSVLFQYIAIQMFSVYPSWDFGVIVNNAKTFLEKEELNEYFVRYPNNIFIVLILSVVAKVSMPDLYSYQIFNVIIITFSNYLIYRITSKLEGKSLGIISLFASTFFFPYIFYSPIVYTDTVSLLFLLLPLHILLDQSGKFRNNPFIITIASIVFSFGVILKGSLIIFLIAYSLLLYLVMRKWRKLYFAFPFLVMLIIKSLFTYCIYENKIMDKQQVEKYSFPLTHWIVMGQNESNLGKYAGEDVESTNTLLKTNSKEKVFQIHFHELKKRIKEKGWEGNIRFTAQKISHTWTDGTYYALNKLKRNPVKPENITTLVNNDTGQIIQGYARIQHILLLAGVLFVVRWRKKNEFITFSMMSIIGFFLFFILWEARSRYIVSLTPLLIIVSCIGYFGVHKEEEYCCKSKLKNT